jgi:hypothetical protein
MKSGKKQQKLEKKLFFKRYAIDGKHRFSFLEHTRKYQDLEILCLKVVFSEKLIGLFPVST